MTFPRLKTLFSVIFMSGAFLVTHSAFAEENPIRDLFQKLLTPPANQASTEPAKESRSNDIYTYFELDTPSYAVTQVQAASSQLKLDFRSPGREFPLICEPDGLLKSSFEELNRLIKTGAIQEEIKAAGIGLTERSAACALVLRQPSAPVDAWAFYAGTGLLAGITSNAQATDPVPTRARIYLTYASDRGWMGAAKAITQLDNLVRKETAKESATNKAQVVDSYSFVRQLRENSFGFWRKNTGQLVVISGPVTRVSGDDRGVWVTLDGAPKSKPVQERAFGDEVGCYITVSSEIDKAALLKVGQNANLMGNVKKGEYNNIELDKCSIK